MLDVRGELEGHLTFREAAHPQRKGIEIVQQLLAHQIVQRLEQTGPHSIPQLLRVQHDQIRQD